MRIRLANLATTALFIASPHATASVAIEENYNYYDIKGSTTTELRMSINSHRDKATDLKGYDASTHWLIQWSFHYQPTQTGCRVTDADVTLTIEYKLPRWPGRGQSTNQHSNDTWDGYIANLIKHELQHGDIAKTAARNVETLLTQTKTMNDTCANLQESANKAASGVVDKSRSIHQNFDRTTNHGINTGAVFP